MRSTRERQERFIKSFDNRTVRSAVEVMVSRYGLGWLTDAQIHDITADLASDAMAETKRNIRNRRINQTLGQA